MTGEEKTELPLATELPHEPLRSRSRGCLSPPGYPINRYASGAGATVRRRAAPRVGEPPDSPGRGFPHSREPP